MRRKAGGIDYSKTKEQRKRDGKAALQRIAKRLSSSDVKPKDIALSIIAGDPSPAVSRLLEEQHPWLRSAQEAKHMGKWCWLAACIHNHVAQDITLTGIRRADTCQAYVTGCQALGDRLTSCVGKTMEHALLNRQQPPARNRLGRTHIPSLVWGHTSRHSMRCSS